MHLDAIRQLTGLRPCGWFPVGSLSNVWFLFAIFLSLWLVSALTTSIVMESRCILGFDATGLRPCGWLPQGSLSEVWRALCYISIALVGVCFEFFGFPGNWLSTSWVIPTKIARGSVMGCLLYFYQCGWCLPWRHPDWRHQRAFSVLDNRFATDENGREWHFRVHCRV